MSEEIIAGLDIGSANIRLVVGQLISSKENEQLNIVGVIEVPSAGVSKGSVVSIEDAVSSISTCLEKAERMIGLPIKSVWVGMGGTHLVSHESSGVIAIARTNGEIQEGDIDRVIDAARAVSAPVNYEVLHIIPKTFSIDNQTGIKDPIGMSGIRLEVTTQVLRGLASHKNNLMRCLYRTGLEVNDVVVSMLAASEVVLSVRQKELGVALVDIGAATTNIIVFEEGNVIHAAVLPVGSNNMTGDLALMLKTSIEVAERVKLEFGQAMADSLDGTEEINLRDLGGDNQIISKKFISDVINARVEQIFEMIDAELKKINRSGLLPAGIVLIGGGARLPRIVEVGRQTAKLPVAVAAVQKFNSSIDKVNDVTFVNALGLMLLGYHAAEGRGHHGTGLSGIWKATREFGVKFKKWLKALIS